MLASASWEIDLWGRIRRQTEAARASVLATEQARRGVILSLVAQVLIIAFSLSGAAVYVSRSHHDELPDYGGNPTIS